MKQIADCTEINTNDRKISNHSGRKSLVQILKRFNISNTECMASTRHKTEQGLARYERAEIEMQHNNATKLGQVFGFDKDETKSSRDDHHAGMPLLFVITLLYIKHLK